MTTPSPSLLRFAAGSCSLLPATLLLGVAAYAAPPTIPGQPIGTVSGDTVALTWRRASDDEGVEGYNLYRDGRYLTTVQAPSYRASLGANTTTRFYVTAFDSPTDGSERGYSLHSPEALFERAGVVPPASGTVDVAGAVRSLTGTRNAAGAISLAWQAAKANDLGYNVYRDDRYLTTVAGAGFVDSGLRVDTSYRYYIVAFDDAKRFAPKSGVLTVAAVSGSGQPTTPVDPPSNGPDSMPPSAATALTARTVNGVGVQLGWTAATDTGGIRGYNVYRDDRYIASVSRPGFLDTAAANGSRYYVIAFDQAINFGPRSATTQASTGNPALLPASPPEQDDPQADPLASPDIYDPFGYFLELDIGTPVEDGAPTQPRHLRMDLVSNDWSEFSWSPSSDDGELVAYEITRSDGVSYRLTEALAPGLSLDPGTYEEYAKYWATTSFIDCNATRFAFPSGSDKERDAPWNCAATAPRPGDDFSYTVAAIDDQGNRSPESDPISIAYAETIGAPVPLYRDFYLPSDDDFATTTDLSNTAYFLDAFDLVFEDEFDSSGVDRANWKTSLVWGDSRIINGEQQYFVDTQRDPDLGYDPFVFGGAGDVGTLDGNALTLTAQPVPDALRERLPATCLQPDPTGLGRCEFLSGALSSWDRLSFIYGYVEGRIKVSDTKGALSSFYLYHRYQGGGARPAYRHGPEIDIVEYLGENPFGAEDAFQTYHFVDPNTAIIRSSPTMNVQNASGGTYGGDYHTFGVLWEPQLVIWYIDGREVKRLRGPQVARQPMNIVNYLVTGSSWAPTPIAADFPIEMGVDYIRVYQREVFKGTAFRGPQ